MNKPSNTLVAIFLAPYRNSEIEQRIKATRILYANMAMLIISIALFPFSLDEIFLLPGMITVVFVGFIFSSLLLKRGRMIQAAILHIILISFSIAFLHLYISNSYKDALTFIIVSFILLADCILVSTNLWQIFLFTFVAICSQVLAPILNLNSSLQIESIHQVENIILFCTFAVLIFITRKDQTNLLATVENEADELKKREELLSVVNAKLAESEEKYRRVVDTSPETIVLADLDGNIIFANQEFARMHAMNSPEEWYGKSAFELIAPEDHQKAKDVISQMIEKDLVKSIEFTFLKQDGTRLPVEISGSMIRGENGTPQAMLILAKNIADRKQAEQTLIESEEKYRLLVQNAPAGIYEFDLEDFRFTSVNDVMCEYTGYSEEEFLEMDALKLLTEDSKKALSKLLDEVYAGNQNPEPIEYRIKGKNNREFDVLVNSRFFFVDGVPKRVTSVAHDLTVLRQAEAEKRQLEVQLHQAQKMEAIGTLAGGIAHDFNNILSAIIGYTELTQMSTPAESPISDYQHKILKAGNRAKDLIQQILTFSRQSEHELKPVQMKVIINEALKLLRATLPTNIEIQQSIQTDSLVMGDPTQIHQILMNLCTNAGHAMLENGGTLEVDLCNVELDEDFTSRYPDLKPGNFLSLTVSDTGHGMPPDVLSRIFNPFFTTKERGEGTGMGLAVVHGIVESYGGIIYAYSEPQKGSSFKVYLPAIESIDKPHEMADEVIPTGTESILFVDDEPFLVEIGQRMLQSLGYQVITRTSSTEALDLFRANPDRFDLVITDMTMPQMTGDKLAGELIAVRKDIPIIICTGFSHRMTAEGAKDMGIKDFLMKPIVRSEIANKVRSVLDAVKANI